MPKILIASTSEEENHILRKKVDTLDERFGDIRFVSVRPQGIMSTIDAAVNIVILNVLNYSEEYKATLANIRNDHYDCPILVMAKAEPTELIRELRTLSNTVFLEKPFDAKDLRGIIMKFLNARAVSQRVYRRYNTEMSAQIDLLDNTTLAKSTLFNLSKGGAYVEVAQMVPLQSGSRIKIHIQLDEVQRSYAMPARVVWTSPHSNGGGLGIGIEFIGRGETTKNLIGRL